MDGEDSEALGMFRNMDRRILSPKEDHEVEKIYITLLYFNSVFLSFIYLADIVECKCFFL